MYFNVVLQKKEKIDRLKTIIKTLKDDKRRAELHFIKEHGLDVNDLAEIKDEKEFYRLLEEFHTLPEVAALNEQIKSAETEKRQVEDDLIEEVISISPADIAAGIRKFYHLQSFRQKTLDTFLKNLHRL